MNGSAKSESSSDVACQLDYILACGTRALEASLGSDARPVHDLSALKVRPRDNRLQVAVLGQFKRGKSSFLNALLGAPILPVGVVPLTAIPVFIAWHETSQVQVCFSDGRRTTRSFGEEFDEIREFLFRFVAEEANPQNHFSQGRIPDRSTCANCRSRPDRPFPGGEDGDEVRRYLAPHTLFQIRQP